MKKNIIFIALLMVSAVASAQVSKPLAKMYEENKYKEVVSVVAKYENYFSREDEMNAYDLADRSYYALQVYDSVVYYANKALAIDNDATFVSAWSYIYRGMALYWQGKKEEGINDEKKTIALDKTPNSVAVAKEFLDNLINNSVPDPKYNYYFSQGEYKNAIVAGRQQLEKQEYKDVMEIVGASYFNLHNYDSTIYFERKAIAADHDSTLVSGWAHTYLGMALYNTHDKDNAVTELIRAIALNKTSQSVGKAEGYLNSVINGRLLEIDFVHQAIKDKLIGRDDRAAANMALACVTTHPDDALAWDQLSSAYMGLHNYDSSLYCAQMTLGLDKGQTPATSEVHFQSGIDRFMKNDKDAADAEFTKALDMHASDNLRKKVKNARQLMGLTDTYDRWKTVERDNLIFHFQDKKSINDVEGLMQRYETEYANAVRVLPAALPKKIEIFVWKQYGLGDNPQQNNEQSYTDDEFCVVHVAQNTNIGGQVLKILGHWQQK